MNSYDYDRYQANDTYWKASNGCCSNNEKEIERPSEEELTKKRIEAFSIKVKNDV